METFYLGSHMPHWLGDDSPLPFHVPLCVARNRLTGRKTLPRARGRWLFDSSGFSVLSRRPPGGGYATWTIDPRRYVREVRRYRNEIGQMDACAPMDWMCEQGPIANTGLSVAEHLRRTVGSSLELLWLAPDLPWMHVIQGADIDDYLWCVDLFDGAGIDLAAAPMVGVGSVCRRQSTAEIVNLLAALHRRLPGIKLHGFGVKTDGLRMAAPALHSADSMAWAKRGQNVRPCRHTGAKSEANCPYFALQWRAAVLRAAATTTAAQWERTADTAGEQGALCKPPPGPAMPTYVQALVRGVRVLLPEGADGVLPDMIADIQRRLLAEDGE